MHIEPRPFYSSVLNGRRNCYVLLPDDYQPDTRQYPVIYLLHGMHGVETDWLYRGNAERTVQQLTDEGDLRDCIIAMPNDGGHDRGTFYMDWYDGSGDYEAYLMHDVLPAIDHHYATKPDREARMIGGLSMGGYGAVMLALRHPETFAAAGSISGAIFPLESTEPHERARLLGPLTGPHAAKYDLARLAAATAERKQTGHPVPTLWLNCGNEDELLDGNRWFSQILRQHDLDHDFTMNDGGHNFDYFAGQLPRMLQFFEHQFRHGSE